MKNKKAVSEMVGYVMLIVIAVALSVLVYAFLRAYVPVIEKKCPDNVAIGIEDYFCKVEANGEHTINLTLRNTGTFDIDGHIIRLKTVLAGKTSTVTLDKSLTEDIGYTTNALAVGNSSNFVRNYTGYGTIDSIEIEPYRIEDMQIILCQNSVISQKIYDCT
jgi:FlaG/FlaF family flagellin (archaellin)